MPLAAPAAKITGSTGRMHGEIPVTKSPEEPDEDQEITAELSMAGHECCPRTPPSVTPDTGRAATHVRALDRPLQSAIGQSLLVRRGRDADPVRLEAVHEPLQLDFHGQRPGTARRRPPGDRHPGLQQGTASAPEGRVGLDQLGQRDVAFDRVADQSTDHLMGLAEGHALLHQPLGQVDGGHRRTRRPPPASGRCRSVTVAIRPVRAARPRWVWRTESNSGSLSSCRSRL